MTPRKVPWFTLRVLALAALLALTACGGTVETPGEPLRLLREPLPQAFIGEPYRATLRAAGGLRPFTYTLSDGELAPGLQLAGGTISGTPTATGRYTFTVTVSDASLNKTFEEYALTVSEVPPPTIAFNVPATQIQRPVTLRAVVDGRELRALRTRLTWDAERFTYVEGSLTHADDLAVLSRTEPGSLQVHLTALGDPIGGARQVFSFDLEPIQAGVTLRVQSETEFLARSRHFFASGAEGAPPEPAGDEGADPASDPDGADGSGDEGVPDDETEQGNP